MSQIAIYTKDVSVLWGVCQGTAKRRLKEVRVHYGKPHRAVVTIAEFCTYYKLNEAEVRAALRLM